MNGQPIPTGVEQIQPPVQTPVRKGLPIKIPPKIKEAWNKFYANKKIFWPVTIALGLFLLVLIVGILFGTGNGGIKTARITSTPEASITPEATESADVLTTINAKLNQLDTQIKELDIVQSRLSPPPINFDIEF